MLLFLIESVPAMLVQKKKQIKKCNYIFCENLISLIYVGYERIENVLYLHRKEICEQNNILIVCCRL
jgi:hypothetical protein